MDVPRVWMAWDAMQANIMPAGMANHATGSHACLVTTASSQNPCTLAHEPPGCCNLPPPCHTAHTRTQGVVYITDESKRHEVTSWRLDDAQEAPPAIDGGLGEATTTHVVVVVDHSGSMRKDDVPGYSSRTQAVGYWWVDGWAGGGAGPQRHAARLGLAQGPRRELQGR